MPGPQPKPDKIRRAKKSTSAELVADPNREFPPLPAFPPVPQKKDRETGDLLPQEPWHPMAREFWNDVWTGPTGSQYTSVDAHGLLSVATLIHRMYSTDDLDVFQKCVAEIRLQSRRFGLDPMARASLNWTVADSKGAVEKQEEREAKRKAARERRAERTAATQAELPGGEVVDGVVVDPAAEAELAALGG
jgi:hypothetical protein